MIINRVWLISKNITREIIVAISGYSDFYISRYASNATSYFPISSVKRTE